MIAIELFFDQRTDQAVREVWETLQRQGIASLASAPAPQHPHLTLAVGDQPDPKIIARIAAELPPLPEIHLDAAGCFPGRGGVVFLAVRFTPELAELHRVLHTVLDDGAVRQLDQLRPGRLVPHCTVAKRLPEQQVGPAVATARASLPISGTAVSVNAVVVGSGQATRIR
ncbi:2'-5' RNA ligase family protein [Microlunatus sp. GCM10028923]|uniref:2'-5' RNA ligase family protein n=1 Tax=Microlunatus sp. GCM10028923 TaxID=3273400 RepID=UPI00361AE0DC